MTGLSAESGDPSFVVKDAMDGDKLYLFKPLKGETPVPRAEARGVRKGEQGPREVGASITADEIGVAAAKARLVTIDKKPGVLIEWHPKNTLADLAITNYPEFLRLTNSEKFKAAMNNLDALDYLINNLDRARNFANYLYEFTPDGTLKLTAIDHGLTFTSTKERAQISGYTRDLPETYSPEMAQKLRDLSANRSDFVNKIQPFVGAEAIPGVLHRLDAMIADMTVKTTPKP